MSVAKIRKGRDFKYTVLLEDSSGKPKDLTGYSLIQIRKKNADDTILTLREPVTAAVDEVQSVSYPATPTEGSFKFTHPTSGLSTAEIAFDDDAATIQAALRALAVFKDVTVTGDQTSSGGLVITFTGDDGGRDHDLLTITANDMDVTPVVSKTIKGVGANGITVVNATCGELLVQGSERESNALDEGEEQVADLLVRIGDEDLNIEDTLLYDVIADPLS